MRAEFAYSDARVPVPLVPVVVGSSESEAAVPEAVALVDSGADRTLIPQAVIDQLAVSPITHLEFEVSGGEVITLPIFRVRLTVGGFPPLPVEVAVSAGEECPLLGRDVLNLFAVLLDGPNRRVEFRDE